MQEATASSGMNATNKEGTTMEKTEHKVELPTIEPAANVPPSPEQKPKKRKLTKEEKVALKIQKKLLKKQKALENSKQVLRDHLLRELKYTEITYKRGFHDWEEMCLKLKLDELKTEVEQMWQDVNRILDRKNFQVRLVVSDLEVAEEQHSRNFSKHIEIIEYLLKFSEYYMNSMKTAYETDVFKIIKDFLVQTNAVNEIHKGWKQLYEDITHSSNFIIQDRLNVLKKTFHEKKTDIIDTNIEHRYNLRDTTVDKMAQMYNTLLSIVRNLQQDALDPKRQTRYNQYMEKQQAAQADFIVMKQAANKGQAVIYSLNNRLTKYENLGNVKSLELRNERKYFVEYYWNLKENYKKDVQFAEHQLSILAGESHKALTNLKMQQRYGELLLGLAKSCRKLQTEKEKVIPWPTPSEIEEMMKHFDDSDKGLEHTHRMELFWYRVCRAQTHVLCLKEEKRRLEEENARYCEQLKSCFEVETYEQVINSLNVNSLSVKQLSCFQCNE